MRHKKPPPAVVAALAGEPQKVAVPPTTSEIDLARTIQVIEGTLMQVMDPSTAVTPSTLRNMMEMFISLLHLRKVTPEYWMENLSHAVRGLELGMQIEIEHRMAHIQGLTPEAAKQIQDATSLSLNEIKALRTKLLGQVTLIQKCPPLDTVVH